MVKRSTWILLIILVLVLGIYFLLEKKPFKTEEPTPTIIATQYLITSTDGDLLSLHVIDDKGNSVRIQKDMSGTWIITEPAISQADQGLISAANTEVAALRIVATLTTPPAIADIGLGSPSFVIEMGFSTGLDHRVEIGKITPTKSGYYTRFDSGAIYIIGQSGIDALVQLISSPPYQATATPPPTEEGLATPTVLGK
jgi:hypothetical protein